MAEYHFAHISPFDHWCEIIVAGVVTQRWKSKAGCETIGPHPPWLEAKDGSM